MNGRVSGQMRSIGNRICLSSVYHQAIRRATDNPFELQPWGCLVIGQCSGLRGHDLFVSIRVATTDFATLSSPLCCTCPNYDNLFFVRKCVHCPGW